MNGASEVGMLPSMQSGDNVDTVTNKIRLDSYTAIVLCSRYMTCACRVLNTSELKAISILRGHYIVERV